MLLRIYRGVTMSIGKKIIELRNKKGWTQYKLFKEAGIGQSTLSRIEDDTRIPNTETLQKIANALGVSMAEFDDNPTVQEEKKYPPFKELFWARAEQLDLTDRQKKAAEAFKQLPIEEQREWILKFTTHDVETNVYTINTDKIVTNIKKLSPEKQKALDKLIETMAQSD